MQIDKKPLTIRKATIEDAELILEFIKALALYEKLENDVSANKNLILKNLFGENTKAYCLIAEYENEAAGFAIYFYNFSTFLAKPGLYLEDLFVKPEFRAKGIGKALIKELAKIAIEEDLGRIEWWVLDWNTPSIEIYKSLGAIPMDEWTVFRVTADKFKSLAC
jgi:GNAT superfamily N-acetyltransferase